MKTTCQFILITWVVLRLFSMLWQDFNGLPAQKPLGFGGAVMSVVVTLANAAVLFAAGAFAGLF